MTDNPFAPIKANIVYGWRDATRRMRTASSKLFSPAISMKSSPLRPTTILLPLRRLYTEEKQRRGMRLSAVITSRREHETSLPEDSNGL